MTDADIAAARGERLEELVRAGLLMRQLQRDYFRTRERTTLIASKEAERAFDLLLSDTTASGDPNVCPHGIHYDNACGACVPPRGTTVRR